MEDKIIRHRGATLEPPMPAPSRQPFDGVAADQPLDIPPWSSPYRFADDAAVVPQPVLRAAPHQAVPRQALPPEAKPGATPEPSPPAAMPQTTLFRPATASAATQSAIPDSARQSGLAALIDSGLTGRGRGAAWFAGALLVGGAGLAAWAVLGGRGGAAAAVTATYTAPTLVLRAAIGGRVMAIDAAIGDAVGPDTRLLVLRVGSTSALPIKGPSDLIIRARVRGVVRGLDAPAGVDVVAGTPIARLADCDRAFLAIKASDEAGVGTARPGMRVRVTLPGQDGFTATLRDAAGNGEPPNTLIADPDEATNRACPLGAIASLALLKE